jgi:uncharacterized protein (TIGR00299 family) protein
VIAYIDLASGISGDIFLGCLVDAGWPLEQLQAVLSRLRLEEDQISLQSSTVMRGPLRGTLVSVKTTESHHHRHLHDVRAIIEESDLSANVKQRATAVFSRLAEAEAKVHGTTPDSIHFHEVGALDAIADIVGVVAGLEAMQIEKLYASSVPLGEGWTRSQHGPIPLPAPATLELLAAAQAPTRPAPGPGELVTPTGAALLAELATFSQPHMRLHRIGIGAGQREFAWPNVARLWLGEGQGSAGPMIQIETNIDNMNPELYQATTEKLFAAGAVDVWLAPIQMKKGRPGVVLSVLAPAGCEATLADIMLRETTTLGLRVTHVHRHEARREIRSVPTQYGRVQVKLKWVGEELVGATPEYEDCRRLAEEQTVALRLVYEAAQAAAHVALIGTNAPAAPAGQHSHHHSHGEGGQPHHHHH